MSQFNIKEIFYTLQGEGQNSGRPAVFCRFSKCNLWSGREQDRAKAICKFCDTDFLGTDGANGGKLSEDDILEISTNLIPNKPLHNNKQILVVFTGGEPALQITSSLVEKFKHAGFFTSIETNGTITVPENLDWITVSPKANTILKQNSGQELKIVYPQNLDPEDYIRLNFQHFLLSPMTSNDLNLTRENIRKSVEYCLKNPTWRLSYQNHKIWQIP